MRQLLAWPTARRFGSILICPLDIHRFAALGIAETLLESLGHHHFEIRIAAVLAKGVVVLSRQLAISLRLFRWRKRSLHTPLNQGVHLRPVVRVEILVIRLTVSVK